MLKEILEVIDVLDDPRSGANEFNALLPKDVCETSIQPYSGPLGKTEFVAYRFKGSAGRRSGGAARTIGIVGSLGAMRLPGDYAGMNSDADGCLVALACALRPRPRSRTRCSRPASSTHRCPASPSGVKT